MNFARFKGDCIVRIHLSSRKNERRRVTFDMFHSMGTGWHHSYRLSLHCEQMIVHRTYVNASIEQCFVILWFSSGDLSQDSTNGFIIQHFIGIISHF